MPFVLNDALRHEYEQLFASCSADAKRKQEAENNVAVILRGKPVYTSVGTPLGIPWFFVGMLHMMECSCSFQKHLHNGDPLRAKTVDDPAGRPVNWPPATWDHAWEESANDALTFDGFHKWHDWSIGGLLYSMELYNGVGSRNRGIHTPYLWAGSQHYTAGKYIADHVWSPTAVSRQIGAAVMLRLMMNQHLVEIG